MLKTLLKKQMEEIFRSFFYDAKKNKARSKGAVVASILLFSIFLVGMLGGMFTFLSVSLCQPLVSAQVGWLYFSILGGIAVTLGAFGSVFNTYASLYLAQDNDLLLSMPIPTNQIMTARLLSVYLMGAMYSCLVMLPAILVYWIVAPVTFLSILGSILLMLLVTILVLTLSCALGWIVAAISRKLKNKSFITVMISLVFITLYYVLYYKAQDLIRAIIANATDYGAKIQGAAYPLYLFGRVGTGDIFAMLMVSAVVLGLFALLWCLISRSFLKFATDTGSVVKKEYKEGVSKVKSVNAALLSREFQRFTASPNYMLNCGLGSLLLLAWGIVLIFVGKGIILFFGDILGQIQGSAAALLITIICTLASMNYMACPSVSLEGKSLWLVKSLPVTSWQVLRAKLWMHLLLTGLPTGFCLVLLAIFCPLAWYELLFVLLESLICVILFSLFNLFLGLKMPNLTWTNENVPIKQGGNLFLAMLGGMFYSLAIGVGYLLIGYRIGFFAYMGIFAVVGLLLSMQLYYWLRKKGAAEFSLL